MKRHLLACFLCVCAGAPAAVQAQVAMARAAGCGQRADIVVRLAEIYGETRRSPGIAGADAVVEFYASALSGTWTLTVTDREGTMCLVASGRSGRLVAGIEATDV